MPRTTGLAFLSRLLLNTVIVCFLQLPHARSSEFQVHWNDRYLTIEGAFPGNTLSIHYLEAYCRSGSTTQEWHHTVIPHTSKQITHSKSPDRITIEDTLADGVIVQHVVQAEHDGISFFITASNQTTTPSDVHWAQPCIRLDTFTGCSPAEARAALPAYIQKCFLAIDNTLTWLPTSPWATHALYTPGQVYCPKAVPRGDVNPRPLSPLVPSHGLCGCTSKDNEWIIGTVWEPYQEIFQGVATCMHNDFRIGGLKAGETKEIRGRLYILKGDEHALLAAYQRDFPQQAHGLTAAGSQPSTKKNTSRKPSSENVNVSLDESLQMLHAVEKEGKGNPAATKAWRIIAAAPVSELPTILRAFDNASPLTANWLRAAVESINTHSLTLPLEMLERFLQDTSHDPRARRLAWELIHARHKERAELLIQEMLDDPSVELRFEAVSRLVSHAAAQRQDDPKSSVETLRTALAKARDVNQIKRITTLLKDDGITVDLQTQFGFLSQWKVIGPFDNSELKGFGVVYPPEDQTDLTASYKGKFGDVRWKKYVTADPYGMVDLNKAYPGPDDGLKEVVAYAVTEFKSKGTQPAEVRLGCKNAWKVWHNGTLVFSRDEYHRGMRIDQYRLPIELSAGTNIFLIKLCQDGQQKDWTKQWQFQLRICDETGKAILATDRPPTPLNDDVLPEENTSENTDI